MFLVLDEQGGEGYELGLEDRQPLTSFKEYDFHSKCRGKKSIQVLNSGITYIYVAKDYSGCCVENRLKCDKIKARRPFRLFLVLEKDNDSLASKGGNSDEKSIKIYFQ